MITQLVSSPPALIRSRVVAVLPDQVNPGRVRHLLHCGHVVVCNGAFSARVEITCPQCMSNAMDALDSVPERAL